MRGTSRKMLTLFVCLCLCLGMCVFSPVKASADYEIPKLLTTAVPTPVALMEVNNIPAATSTPGCYVSAYNWYDKSGNVVTGQFGTKTVTIMIQVSTMDGYSFTPDVAVYLNNSRAAYTLSADRRTVTLTRDYTPDVWLPTIIKHPGNETIDEGDMASFVATALYYESCSWIMMSPDGQQSFDTVNLPGMYPGMSTSTPGTNKMNLYDVPGELDGWSIFCVFHGPGGDSISNAAKLTVHHEERELPPEVEETELAAMNLPEESPEPDESGSPAEGPAAEPEATPEPEPEKEDHIHDFSGAWQINDTEHWKQCSCGEKDQLAPHDMVWTTFSAATRKAPGIERGVCRVCSHTDTREVEYEGSGMDSFKLMGYALIGVGVLIVLIILLMIIAAIRDSVRRRRRRRRRRRKY